jgi:ParB family chromosome partitioning protein
MSTPAALILLPVTDVAPSTVNPRRSIDAGKLAELQASIAASGIQEMLLVRPMRDADDGSLLCYEIVAGHRRFAAAQALGWTEVPCVVREMTDSAAQEVAIVSNLQRADVHPMDEAHAYKLLIADSSAHGLGADRTAEDIAKRVGKPTSYVARRLKLVDLIAPAAELFLAGHLTLGHAELLARLTAPDQMRGVRQLLQLNNLPAKTDIAARVTQMIAEHDPTWRMVRDTERQLKEWIERNVLLQLGKALWPLDDAMLLPEAGACTTCPKRSGSNAALFGDLTAAEDVCLDGICCAAKHKAHLKRTQVRAAQNGKPLLKLSCAGSLAPLPETVTDKLTFKHGQWLTAKVKSCAAVAEGLILDASGPYATEKYAAGDVLWVCVDQRCKVHPHKVQDAAPKLPGGAGKPAGESWDERQVRETKEAQAIRAAEEPVLRAVYDALKAKVTPESGFLQSYIAQHIDSAGHICAEMGIDFGLPKGKSPGDYWFRKKAEAALLKFIGTATLAQLHQVAFHALLVDELRPPDSRLREEPERVRAELWRVAKHLGVDADAIAAKVSPAKAAAADAPMPPAKAAAKKAAKPAAPAQGKVAKPNTLSDAKRKKIADNMKKRWAKTRADAAKGNVAKPAKKAVKA